MRTWLSIIGLYNYRDDIFDLLELPDPSEIAGDMYVDDISPLRREDLINMLLFELGELGLVYTDPDMIKAMIGIWSRTERDIWLDLWKTKLYKYNPIWNKDGTIRERRDIERAGSSSGQTVGSSGTDKVGSTSGSRSGTSSNLRTLDTATDVGGSETGVESVSAGGTSADTGTVTDEGQHANTHGHTGSGSVNETVAHNVTGYDSNQYSPNTQDVKAGSTSDNSTDTDNGTDSNTKTLNTVNTVRSTSDTETGREHTETTSNTGTIDDAGRSSETSSGQSTETVTGQHTETESGQHSETVGESYERIEQGNIGVTTTQAMITEQREIVQFNLYAYIIQSFKHKFCVMVY